MFFRLLLESFRRQRRRKTLAGLAILLGATAVTAMLALATTIGDRIHAELAVYGANIIVTPKTANLDVNIGGTDIHPTSGTAYLKESDLAKLKTIFWANNITGISPELKTTEILNVRRSKTIAVPIVGLWFDQRWGSLITGAPQMHPWWHLVGKWPNKTEKESKLDYSPVVVGSRLAQRLDLKIGEGIDLSPQDGSQKLDWATISGIVATDSDLDDAVITSLDAAQFLAGTPDAVSRVEISARTKPEDAFARRNPDSLSPSDRDRWYCSPYANSITYQIREAIPTADAQQVRRVEQSEGAVLSRISGLMWLISAAALLAAAFAVSAAMATAILERRTEIGLMRSLGAPRAAIALLFYTETGLLALLAGAFGYLLGSGLAAWLGARIFPDASDASSLLRTAFNPVLLPVTVGLALLIAIAGSTPSIRAALNLDPAATLRSDA